MTWVVVGREQSGDEDDNVSGVEAFGPFNRPEAQKWLRTAPTFEGVALLLTPDIRRLLGLFGVELRSPDATGADTP